MTSVSADLAPERTWRVDPSLLRWIALFAFAAICLVAAKNLPWLAAYPKAWALPVAQWINAVFDFFLPVVKPIFRAITIALDTPMRGLQTALQWLPWPLAMVMAIAIALRAGGKWLAAFAVATLLYVLLAGYWRESMNTLALVTLAVPLATAIGFGLGVLGHLVPRARAALNTTLDLMQTVPAFAYLIPLLLLFGFGPVVGLLASAIYAAPPMVRNTMLGLSLVPDAIKESAEMCGCTPWQRFWQAEIPAARPQLLVGLNQTTNATLSMVIVAAIIGGFSDIGWEVLSSMRKADFGQSVLSGLVIALLAILIDRITLGFAESARTGTTHEGRWLLGWRLPLLLLGCVAASAGVHVLMAEPNASLPGAEARLGIVALNDGLKAFLRSYSGSLETIRNSVLYMVMLPLRIGIQGCATLPVWGFELTPLMMSVYAAGTLALSVLAERRSGWRAAAAIITAAVILYFGLASLPWPILIALISLFAFDVAGPAVAVLTAAGLGFILLTGLWPPFIRSLYLCTVAVLLCIAIGGPLGLWASQNSRVSAFLRPINDALQTMPQFVFLIPALMFFQVGEFTALIAVCLYAIVPPIRYVEHGLRTVPDTIVEAARQMGTTGSQMLWQVKLPLAMPVVMLGINQTIMAALSMLTIAALVGTSDLGQQVYIALGKADAGLGIVAGVAIALMATISDRILQGWAKRQSRPA
jgi:glycine betaine/proline transport system permease protein